MNFKKNKAQSLVECTMLLALVFLIAIPSYALFGDEAQKVFNYIQGKVKTGFSSVNPS